MRYLERKKHAFLMASGPWWQPSGLSREDCIAAYQFKGAQSKESALKDLTEHGFDLSEVGGANIEWTEADGYYRTQSPFTALTHNFDVNNYDAAHDLRAQPILSYVIVYENLDCTRLQADTLTMNVCLPGDYAGHYGTSIRYNASFMIAGGHPGTDATWNPENAWTTHPIVFYEPDTQKIGVGTSNLPARGVAGVSITDRKPELFANGSPMNVRLTESNGTTPLYYRESGIQEPLNNSNLIEPKSGNVSWERRAAVFNFLENLSGTVPVAQRFRLLALAFFSVDLTELQHMDIYNAAAVNILDI